MLEDLPKKTAPEKPKKPTSRSKKEKPQSKSIMNYFKKSEASKVLSYILLFCLLGNISRFVSRCLLKASSKKPQEDLNSSDSDDDVKVEHIPAIRENTRKRAPAKYNFGDYSEDSDVEVITKKRRGKKIESDDDFCLSD